MNQSQRDYLKSRIRNITDGKCQDIKAKHTVKSKVACESAQDQWKLVLAGKVKPRKKPNLRQTWVYVSDLYDFSAFQDKVDQKKVDAETKKLREKAQRIRDKAMLGDCDEAIKLLAELEKF